jgi:hypothetical protein
MAENENTENNGHKTLTKNERLVVLSALVERYNLAGALGFQFKGLRDMYTILGYKKDIQFADYLAKYDRQDISGRVVDLPAVDTWRNPPVIHDGSNSTEDEQPDSAFIQALKGVINQVQLWHYLTRLDRMAGIGRYGILLIGVKGGSDLAQPIEQGKLKPGDIIYLKPFSEGSATINAYETDKANERYGLPTFYDVLTIAGQQKVKVHWSRVLHVAEDLLEDDVLGRPRLKRIYDRLDDLTKIVGGGAEATWKTMDKGLQADIRENYSSDTQTLEQLEAEIDEYLHGLRRFIRTAGVDITPLGSEVIDPSALFGIIISLIAASADIPQRILIGSERGELASSQDLASWAGRIKARQIQFAEPVILRPFIDRMISAGALPAPDGGAYTIEWPSLFTMSDMERADLALKTAQAAGAMSPMSPDIIIPPEEFRVRYLGLPASADGDETSTLDAEDQNSEELNG